MSKLYRTTWETIGLSEIKYDSVKFYRKATRKVLILNDSVDIRLKKYFSNSKSPSSYVITH